MKPIYSATHFDRIKAAWRQLVKCSRHLPQGRLGPPKLPSVCFCPRMCSCLGLCFCLDDGWICQSGKNVFWVLGFDLSMHLGVNMYFLMNEGLSGRPPIGTSSRRYGGSFVLPPSARPTRTTQVVADGFFVRGCVCVFGFDLSIRLRVNVYLLTSSAQVGFFCVPTPKWAPTPGKPSCGSSRLPLAPCWQGIYVCFCFSPLLFF